MCATPNIVVFLSLISPQNPIPRTRRLFGACLLPENRTFSLKWCLAHPNLLPFLGEYEKSLEKFGFSYMWLWYLQTPLSNAKFGVESDERHQKSIWNVIPLQNQTFRTKHVSHTQTRSGGAFGLKNHIFYESRYNVIPNRCRSSLQMESKVVQSGSSASKAACTRYIQFHASGLSTSAVT